MSAEEARAPEPGGSRGALLAVLTLVVAINWADRQVVPILFPGLRRDLALTDTELGVISGLAFSFVYAVASFVFGYAADRRRRTRLIALGLVVWSAATAAGSFAGGFWSLFWARFFTGIGEASFYPCALSLVAERFPAASRGRALGLLGAGAALGGGLGVGLGGRLAEQLGWRGVFTVYGAAGLLCLPLLLLLDEPARAAPAADREATFASFRALLGRRSLGLVWATGAVAMAAGQGFGAWGPSFYVRELGLTLTAAGHLFGGAAVIGGIAGGLGGGALADAARRRGPGSELLVPAAAALLASAALLFTLHARSPTASSVGGFVATVAIYAIFPALLSALLSVAEPERRGAASALNTFFVGGIGAASGPFLVGTLSDRTGSLLLALHASILGLTVAALLAVRARRAISSADR